MFDLPHNFGDYTLVAFIGRTRGGILYQAIQQGMDRSVFLELLDPDNPEGVGVEDFLMKARTRAAINAPVLGTVYEASQAQGYWFVTSEQLGGSSLQSMLDRGQTLSMKDLLKVIETVGNVCGRYERLRTAFNIMEPRHIFLDDKSAVRLMNTAVPGDFHEETESRCNGTRLWSWLLRSANSWGFPLGLPPTAIPSPWNPAEKPEKGCFGPERVCWARG